MSATRVSQFKHVSQEQFAAYRLEKTRLDPPMSWDGEPAPDLEAPLILLVGGSPGERPKGDRPAGEVLVGDPDRF